MTGPKSIRRSVLLVWIGRIALVVWGLGALAAWCLGASPRTAAGVGIVTAVMLAFVVIPGVFIHVDVDWEQ